MKAFTKIFYTSSPEETIEVGRKIGERLKGGEVIAYKGGLGAGKTTITRGIAMGMGLPDNVSSPTFAIVNEYHGERLTLYHFDMYRISGGEDLETTGFYDCMSDDAVIAAEWSENIAEELDSSVITLAIETQGEDKRKITLTVPDGGDRFAGNWD